MSKVCIQLQLSLLKKEIKRKQEEMYYIGGKLGLTHENTIQISQSIDGLITTYQKLKAV